MVKQEWKKLFHNPWMIIVSIAIILIPSIYACVFLGSMWDPYGNSGSLPVAVVNEDQEVTYNDTSLDVGNELVNNLEDNDSLDFHFLNKEDALKGLEDGKYYMVITIPSDFSHNATTLLDDQPQKMILNYTTNPGTNYVASKMDDSAIAKIKEEVSATVTKTYAETIFKQVGTLSDGLLEATKGTTQLSDGMNQLTDGNQTISDNLKVLANSTLTFKDGSETLTNGLKDYTDGVVEVNNGMYSLKEGLDTLNNSTAVLQNGMSQLNDGTQALNQGIQQYTSGVSQLYLGTQQLVSNNQKLQAGVQALGEGAKALSTGNQQVVDGLNTMSKQLKASLNNPQMSELEKGYQTIDTYKSFLSALEAQGYNDIATKLKTEGLSAQEVAYITQGQQTQEMPSYISVLETVTSGSQGAIHQMLQGLTALDQGVDQLTVGSSQVQAGINQLSSSISGDQNPNSLTQGINAYLAGTTQVNDGLKQLTSNNASLIDGSQKLSEGTQQLVQNAPALVTGIKALDQGAYSLVNGTTQLVSNNDALVNGARALGNGAQQISSGASQLADGSMTLGQGLHEVQDGVQTLDTALKDGAKQSQMTTTNATYDMLSAPVETNHDEISVVENNGHAMAPYMMSVALYVCGLAFTLMYPILEGVKQSKSGFKYWLSKAIIMYSVSTLAAIIMITALRMINHFEPVQLLNTYLFAILVSAAFMSIIVLLNVTTGYIGEFLLLVFMIINLGGSAGTYPLETSSAFYQAIHAFVPYTYSVDGFRKVISMANASLSTEVTVFVGILIVCSALTILYYQVKKNQNQHLIPQAFEKHE